MRLWHKDLIPVLPKQQLLGQWRELNSIFKLQNRHILINFVYDYSKEHLYTYSWLIIKEMKQRGYKVNLENFDKYFKDIDENIIIVKEELYKDKMNKEYLTICCFNLLEKYRCGGITDDEWKKIESLFNEKVCKEEI